MIWLMRLFACLLALVGCCVAGALQGQPYFPPLTGEQWETTAPEALGWCPDPIDSLYAFLDETHAKAFIVLKDGRIVLEQYFNGHSADLNWYWASAAKTITATLTGIAQEEGLLSLSDPVSDYIGEGWTNCEPALEAERTIYHQLTMSSGFNTFPAFWDCTEPECFQCAVPPGTQWHYHNGVYRQLLFALEAATGVNRNLYTMQKIGSQIGMSGFWLDNLYFSKAREMARFGLLASNDYVWDGQTVLGDQGYIEAMRNTASDINPAYGYLWWLNGKENYFAPLDFEAIDGFLIPSAPADLYAGMGANEQRVYVVPSQGLVVVRMGDAADETAAAVTAFDDELWQRINALECGSLHSAHPRAQADGLLVYPNPSDGVVKVRDAHAYTQLRVLRTDGVTVLHIHNPQADTEIRLPPGLYLMEGQHRDGTTLMARFVVI